MQYRPEIDGLRAIAVVLVLLYHAQFQLFGYNFFAGGFIGVDIFFVISGYLILAVIDKKYNENLIGFFNFLKKRFIRISPNLLLIILIFLIFFYFFYFVYDFLNALNQSVQALLFNSNYFFWKSKISYGAHNNLYNFLLHTWSLSIEFQLYMFLFIIIWPLNKYFKKNILLILTIVFLFFFILTILITKYNEMMSFYFTGSRIFELVLGCIAYQLHKKNFFIKKGSEIGIFIIVLSLFLFKENTIHPSYLTILPLIGSLFFLIDFKYSFIFKNRLFVYIGKTSYALYIIHYPVFSVFYYFQLFENLFFKFIALTTSILLSFFLYEYFELPIRNQLNKSKTKFRYYLISYFLLIISVLLLIKFDGFPNRMSKIGNNHIDEGFNYYSLVNHKNENCFNLKNNCEFNTDSKKKNIFNWGQSSWLNS